MREANYSYSSTVSGTRKWYAAYTIARHEKKVVQHLQSRGVENFLPLYSSVRNWNGRRSTVELPLFPGYLFVCIGICEKLRVLEAPGIVRIIGFAGRLTPLPDVEVQALKATAELSTSRPSPLLVAGRTVMIKRGPLCGLQGVIVRDAREFRVVINVQTIMQAFSVELDRADLEPMFHARM